ncbi:MAG: hydrolase [Candidatus Nitrosotenuis sp.]
MSKQDKDELIRAQNEIIGILFEVIKRLQANNTLDEEYFQILSDANRSADKKRLDEILEERQENSKTVARLLVKLQI